ncbi:putative RNA recognition motif domain-containing protein [Lupinus albus]|uniref:Putative RNA recognition motif domain-containing protein n=1 Tax=Lupinus albus TaxID=3870 RepID=A0A6A4P0G7_LUPAL|nr:putative RNA recognition motif domain-containing protein [Lupinus albus]
MSGKEENRIFVGGLSSDVSERQLHRAFDRYGKILECQGEECEKDNRSCICFFAIVVVAIRF